MSAATSTGAGTRRDVTLRLPQLQNLCKRDPPAYRTDYDAQIRRLRSECAVLALSPSAKPSGDDLVELLQFAAAVSSSSYRGNESDAIAALLIDLLLGQCNPTGGGAAGGGGVSGGNAAAAAGGADLAANLSSVPPSALQLHRDVRKACVSALILMRNKGAVAPLTLLQLFFRLMACVPDKNLREMLHRHIVNDVRNVNKKGKRDEAVNRSIQAFFHRVVSSPAVGSGGGGGGGSGINNDGSGTTDSPPDVAARRATDMVAELYRRGVWTDDRTVAIMASAAQSPNAAVMARSLRFFLGIEEKMADDRARDEADEWESANTIDLHLHSKKTSKKKHRIGKQLKERKKAQHRREQEEDRISGPDRGIEHSKNLYPAIEMLNDPQGLAERLFRRIRSAGSNGLKFETKLLVLNFVTRLVGNHELLLLPLYPFLQRYMGGHQRDVTAVLAYAVQACHPYVPPDEIHGILKTIAHNFITERCSGEQMAVGINAVRAICARVPSVLAVEGEDGAIGGAAEDTAAGGGISMDIEAFVRDLAAFSRHRDRSVSVAGKSWTNFIREVHPSLLQGKDRGREGSALHRAGEKPLRYGEQRVAAGVEGADLLVEYEAQKAAQKKRRDEGEESDSDSDDSDGGVQEEGWNDMPSSDDETDGEDRDDDNDDNDEEVEAPDLVLAEEKDGKMVAAKESNDGEESAPVVKMSEAEREALRLKVSSTRVFSASDFAKMRKLVDREERAKRDPRAAAKLKRAIAKGKQFEQLSDDDSDSDSDDGGIHITGAVDPTDIMAQAKKKRMSKAERLEKIIQGRAAFEAKSRDGGSTNEEKKRKKNFLMTKFSMSTRTKMGGKQSFRDLRGKKHKKEQLGHLSKKRRRKM